MTDDNYFDSEKHFREAIKSGHVRPTPPVEPPRLPDPPRKEQKFDFSSVLSFSFPADLTCAPTDWPRERPLED